MRPTKEKERREGALHVRGSFGDRQLNEAGRADHTQVTALWWYIMRREGLQEFYLIPPIQPSVPLVVNRLAKDNDPSQHDGADKNTSIPFCGHLSRVAPLLFNLYMFN